jgi:hypothetical protein
MALGAMPATGAVDLATPAGDPVDMVPWFIPGIELMSIPGIACISEDCAGALE